MRPLWASSSSELRLPIELHIVITDDPSTTSCYRNLALRKVLHVASSKEVHIRFEPVAGRIAIQGKEHRRQYREWGCSLECWCDIYTSDTGTERAPVCCWRRLSSPDVATRMQYCVGHEEKRQYLVSMTFWDNSSARQGPAYWDVLSQNMFSGPYIRPCTLSPCAEAMHYSEEAL